MSDHAAVSSPRPVRLPGAFGNKVGADQLMWGCIILATVAGYALAWQKYRCFNGDTNDLAIFAHAFAGALHGRFLPLYYMPGSLLGNHLNFVILAWLPVYAVARSFYSLLFFQSLMLTLAAWPFYLLAREVLRSERAALALGGAFLLFPTIVSQHVNQVHDDQFALPFLMYAFYFFWREKLGRFLVMIALACLAKETLTITTAAFGVYALLLRRRWKWVVLPSLFSVVYFGVAMKLLTSVFAGVGGSLYTGTSYLEAYGKSPREVLHTFLTRPGLVLQTMFSGEKLAYLGKLLLPLLYLVPFLSLSLVVSLPNLALNLIGSNIALTVIPWHYNVILGATLLVAAMFGLKQVADWCGAARERVLTGLAVTMLALAALSIIFWYHAEDYQARPEEAQLRRAIAEVPLTASVLCPTPLLAHFSDRPRVNSAYSILVAHHTPEQLADYEYVLLDANWRTGEAFAQGPLYQAVRGNPLYELVFLENNVLLLRRKSP